MDFLGGLDPELQALLAARMAPSEALPSHCICLTPGHRRLPPSITLTTTADLTPELVGGIASFALIAGRSDPEILAIQVDTLTATPDRIPGWVGPCASRLS
jgi:hypothetical protein